MRHHHSLILLTVFFISLLSTSCKKDDEKNPSKDFQPITKEDGNIKIIAGQHGDSSRHKGKPITKKDLLTWYSQSQIPEWSDSLSTEAVIDSIQKEMEKYNTGQHRN
jgi:hypothetical protein